MTPADCRQHVNRTAAGGEAITPALDKLAASAGAVVFDRAYVQQAILGHADAVNLPALSRFMLKRLLK